MTAVPEPSTDADRETETFRLSVRVDFGREARVGPGKIALVEAVARTGSISAAGRALGMSYRRAWMLLDALNRMFDEPVVTASAGGAQGGGAQVTAFGLALVEAYRGLEAECAATGERRFAAFKGRLRPDYRDVPGDPDG